MTNKDVSNYWSEFWEKYEFDGSLVDEQTQVARTLNKQPISKNKWDFTKSQVLEQLELKPESRLLDLCCGNGLFSEALSTKVSTITAVDISEPLIKKLNERNLPNITAQSADIRSLSFPNASFDRVLWYAGIQYLSEPDIILMLRDIRKWMDSDGLLFIGDIPDRIKMWGYFNNVTRVNAYADSLVESKPIIGTWLDREWLFNIISVSGFSKVDIVEQDKNLIYSDFRYDCIART
jgi:ubiquinone/menaquinone biosynthesis C-methylase UbiE